MRKSRSRKLSLAPKREHSRIWKKTLLLPEYFLNRLIGEALILLPVILTLLMLANILVPKTAFEISKDDVLQNPTKSLPRKNLAEHFFANNQFAQGRKEILLALRSEELTDEEQTALRESYQRYLRIENQPEVIKSEMSRLHKISTAHPEYRDGLVRLAILNWKLYRVFESQKFLSAALEVDPNNEEISSIKGILK